MQFILLATPVIIWLKQGPNLKWSGLWLSVWIYNHTRGQHYTQTRFNPFSTCGFARLFLFYGVNLLHSFAVSGFRPQIEVKVYSAFFSPPRPATSLGDSPITSKGCVSKWVSQSMTLSSFIQVHGHRKEFASVYDPYQRAK